jgi:hypothetical protein
MRLRTLTLLAIFLSSPALRAQEAVDAPPAAEPAMGCEETITVFQDVSGIGRKERAAKNMTQRHAAMARDGWRFADMEVYTENGDLEGFYLSYVRAAACAEDDPGKK